MKTGKMPVWQTVSYEKSLKVSTERSSLSPGTSAAFMDSMAIDAVDSSRRFGTVFGLYPESLPSAASGAAAEATVATVAKGQGRVSPWVYAGAGAVLAGGGAAAVAVSLAGDGDVVETDPVTGILVVQGTWSGTFQVAYADGSLGSDSISLSLNQFGNSVTGKMTTADGTADVTGSIFGNFFNMDTVFSCPLADNDVHFEFAVTHPVFTITFISGTGCPAGENLTITGGSGSLQRN